MVVHDEIETLKDLAACVMREIELGTRLREAEGNARRGGRDAAALGIGAITTHLSW